MAPHQHSVIGASSLKRKLECKGSHLLEMSLPPAGRKSSVYAAEGTLCHAISEDCLMRGIDPEDFIGRSLSADGFTFVVDTEMAEGAGLYVEHVRSLQSFGADIHLEERVKPWLPWHSVQKMPVDLFGTCDCWALSQDGTKLEVVDLKYGRGIPVEADMNPQMLYYALGVLSSLDTKARDKITEVTITIVQPRAPHPKGAVRSFTLSMRDMLYWAYQVFKPAVEQMLLPGQPFFTGEHCRFCPCALICPEMQKTTQDAARHAFDDDDPVDALSDADLAKMAKLTQLLEPWIAKVQLELHQRLVAGRLFTDFKLVEKRAARVWDSEADLLHTAETLGVLDKVALTKTEILSPAQAEKALKKQADVWPVLAAHITKKSSGTTFAPASDPRPAVPGRISVDDAFADEWSEDLVL